MKNRTIEELNFSKRAYTDLKRAGLNTLYEICENRSKLYDYRMSVLSIEEIEYKLKEIEERAMIEKSLKNVSDEERLKFLGINNGKVFQLVELAGRYYIKNKKCFEIISGSNHEEVKGLYESVINFKWHVKRDSNSAKGSSRI